MSAVELQQVQETQQAPPSVAESQKPAMNGSTNMASKPSSKQQKGIMGMFASKSAPKNQDCSKEVKPEPKEESPVVSVFVVSFTGGCFYRGVEIQFSVLCFSLGL